MELLKPMLAGKFIKEKLEAQLPVYVQPKLDGIRCLIHNGQALSRSLKLIPNKYIRGYLNHSGDVLEGFDGELIVGEPTDPDCYRKTNSAVMSHNGCPDFLLHVFDLWNRPDLVFSDRRFLLKTKMGAFESQGNKFTKFLKRVPTTICHSLDDIAQYESDLLAEGHEGVILRGPNTFYKSGRATPTQGQLIKVKRFADAEARIVDFEELMHNGNAATKDKLGHTVHSAHKANLVPMNTLGALVCVGEYPDGTHYKVKMGTGFDQATRKDFWDRREELKGQMVKFKYFAGGMKDAPRFPVFLGLRDRRDIS